MKYISILNDFFNLDDVRCITTTKNDHDTFDLIVHFYTDDPKRSCYTYKNIQRLQFNKIIDELKDQLL